MSALRTIVRLVEETGARVERIRFTLRGPLVWDVVTVTGVRWRFWRQHRAIAFAEAGDCPHKRGDEHHCLVCDGFLNAFGGEQ